ncbi:MAG: class I adenylate-forming enzyme family protein [Planctomycetota bacterium]
MDTNQASHRHLRRVLYETFRASPDPIVRTDGVMLPGAALWGGARLWCQKFREIGLQPGDRVVLRAPRSPGHVMVTLAAWWEGLTLCPISPHDKTPADAVLRDYDAAVLIGASAEPTLSSRASTAPTEGIAAIMSTSGTSGTAKRIGLSYTNLLHQLLTHRDALDMTSEDRVLSCLPWHHAFGLLVDLWPALLSGAAVTIDRKNGRSPEGIIDQIHTESISHASFVPAQVAGMLADKAGLNALRALRGGVVGGAPILPSLVEPLASTSLRVGYGQTEASPGIALGRPGRFFAGALGQPVACDWRIRDGELHVRGRNVCAGYWDQQQFRPLPINRWLSTDDLVTEGPDGLVFRGRLDHRFKLDTGRMVDAPALERALLHAICADDAVVFAADASSIAVVLLVDDAGSADRTRLAEATKQVITEHNHRMSCCRVLDTRGVPRTPKGDIDRIRLRQLVLQAKPFHARAA